MMASPDSTEDQAKVLGDAFQKLVLRVRAAEAEIEEQNDVIQGQERRAEAPRCSMPSRASSIPSTSSVPAASWS